MGLCGSHEVYDWTVPVHPVNPLVYAWYDSIGDGFYYQRGNPQ